MPEYLAPGVYVEEIEIGAKPIEGVSTSTAGFLGYAERGPLNKPALVTSFAEFERTFGGFLPGDGKGILDKIRWLAYAVLGFFENGGKRAYINRVASGDAKPASGILPKLDIPNTPINLAGGVEAKNLAVKLAKNGINTLKVDDVLLLSDSTQSEYLQYKGPTKEIPFKVSDTKLISGYEAGTKVRKGEKGENLATIVEAIKDKDTIKLTWAGGKEIIKYDYLLIEEKGKNEVVFVTDVKGAQTGSSRKAAISDSPPKTITIANPLVYDHTTSAQVFKLTPGNETTLCYHASKGEAKLYVDGLTALSDNDFIIIGNEGFQIGASKGSDEVFQISPALNYSHKSGKVFLKLESGVAVTAANEGTWGNSIKLVVKQSSLCKTKLALSTDKTEYLYLDTVTGIEAGSILKLSSTSSPEYVKVKEAHKTSTASIVILKEKISGSFNKGSDVQSEEFDLVVKYNNSDEIFKHLSLDEQHSRYIKKIVTEKSSNLIRIGSISTDKILMPTPDDLPGWLLTGGNDGFPANDSEIDTIYEGKDNLEPALRTGLYTFKNVDESKIVAIPGITSKALQGKLITHCDTIMKNRFAVLDPEYGSDLDKIRYQRNLYDTSFAALYYPWLYVSDPLTGGSINVPPSGCVAGIYARTDVTRGVHKAPANEKINGVFQLEKLNGKFRIVNKGSQDILNPLGINCIREFPGRGFRIWGARTISSDSPWKYINVRRLFLYLEESIERGTQWVVFEPNNEKLWDRVKQTITQFLTTAWKSGALLGTTPEQAFFVKCDRTTMTQDDIDNGRLICIIGVAPVKPAEFVIFRIAQWQGGSAVTE